MLVTGWVDVFRYNGDAGENRDWRRYWAEANETVLSFSINEKALRQAHIAYNSITDIVSDESRLPLDIDDRHVIGLRAGKEWVMLSMSTIEDKAQWCAFIEPRLLPSNVSRSPHHAPSPVISPVTPACTAKHSSPPIPPALDTQDPNMLELLQQYKKLLRGKITREGLTELFAWEQGGSEQLKERIATLEKEQDTLLSEFEQVYKSRKELVSENAVLKEKHAQLSARNVRIEVQQAESESTIRTLRAELSHLKKLCIQEAPKNDWKDDGEPEPHPSQPPVPISSSTSPRSCSIPVSPRSVAISPKSQPRNVSPARSVSPSHMPFVSPALVLSPPAAPLPSRSVSPPLAPVSLPQQRPDVYPLTCHICGSHFLDSLQSHIPKCLKAWFATQKQLPHDCRRLRPPTAPSTSPVNVHEYNRAATEVYLTQAKNRCPFCLQRFNGGVLMEHLSICTARK